MSAAASILFCLAAFVLISPCLAIAGHVIVEHPEPPPQAPDPPTWYVHVPPQAPPLDERPVHNVNVEPEQREPRQAPPQAPTDSYVFKDYQEAHDTALRKGLPLVCWIGEAICPDCVVNNDREFVHYLSTNAGHRLPADSLTVGMPINGEMIYAGQVTQWPDGHVPTVREILRRWREDRRIVTDEDFMSVPGWKTASRWTSTRTGRLEVLTGSMRWQSGNGWSSSSIRAVPIRRSGARRFGFRGAACAS